MITEQGSRLRDVTARECGQSPTRASLFHYESLRGDAQ